MNKYLILTLPDGGLYRLPLQVVKRSWMYAAAEVAGIPVLEVGEVHDSSLLEHSKSMSYSEVMDDLVKLSHGTAMAIRLFWKDAVR